MAENQSIPVYRWEPWPEGMATKKQLAAKKLRPGPVAGKIPYNKSSTGDGWLYVYRESEATPVPPPTPKQIAAREKLLKARTCLHCGRVVGKSKYLHKGVWCMWCMADRRDRLRKISQIRWARSLLKSEFLVLDTETTDLDSSAEIIAITVIDQAGLVLLNSYVKPQKPIDEEGAAFYVNGISNAMVADAPTWPELFGQLELILSRGKPVIAYKAEFDSARIEVDCKRHGLKSVKLDWDCAMLHFAHYYGEWSDYWDDWKWQSLDTACGVMKVDLPGYSHTAAGDALATLMLIRAMSFT